MTNRSLNDLVEVIHIELIDNDKYIAFITALNDAEAVEGSVLADDISAALMIRDKAKELKIDEVGVADLATIRTALNVVLRRYDMSRNQRGGSS
jgi:hypothetical protein